MREAGRCPCAPRPARINLQQIRSISDHLFKTKKDHARELRAGLDEAIATLIERGATGDDIARAHELADMTYTGMVEMANLIDRYPEE